VENDHPTQAKGIFLSLRLKALALLNMLRQRVQNALAKRKENSL
jgi:hypothetical protein